ncbi:TOM1-like protein 2 [Magnolia sinica]|uniref:TOM1-like protein 2 n=1 Tax=Magnolia sinica TaxID=86752 RepID=UPI002657AFE7|nr:TOM1-like protein 2 [Magnolia sinica]
MDRSKLAALGERLKIGGAQMSRTISGKMKEILQVQTREAKMVDEATSEFLEEPNWGLNLRICALLNGGELSGPEVLHSIMKKFVSKSMVCQRMSLDLLEACATNCNKVYSEIASEKVLDEMVRMIDNPQTHFSNKERALQLIRTWGESDELMYLPAFRQTHMSLKARETPFVTQRDLNMETIIIPKESNIDRQTALLPESYAYHGITLPVEEKKEILVVTRNSVELLSSMLNSDGQQKSVKDDLMLSIMEKCKQSQPIIQKIIESTSDDEGLLFDALSLHDELQQVLSKYKEAEAGVPMPDGQTLEGSVLPGGHHDHVVTEEAKMASSST